jgi:benzoate-CoA ligase family protein
MDIPQRFNIGAELIERNLRGGRGDSPAIVSGGKTLTYREVEALTDLLAASLLRAGVEPEQRVLFVLPDSPELAAGYLAAMKIGAVAVPCNPLLRPADYAYFLEESRARLLITSRACIERVEPALSQGSTLRRALIVGESGERSFERWVADTPPQRVAAAGTSRDEPAFWLWTSGSTGRPKAAVHAHQDWPHCCELYGRGVLDLSSGDRCFSASKLFHAYGLGNGLAFPFWVGASTVLVPDRPAPDLVYRTIEEAKPTVFFGVPTLYAAMLAQKEVQRDLSSLRLCVSAGEPLPGELFTRWKSRFGTEILDGIGSTEVLHIYVSPRRGKARPDCTGVPVEGYEVKIVDESGIEVPRGQTGDLVVRGPSTATMYFNRREQTRSKMRGEWFFSGDKFRQTEDGEYHYVGRSDDMFKAGGEWVSPTDLEAVLVSHQSVLEAAVTPRDEGGLMRPQAHVVLTEGREGSPELAEELRQHVRSRCAGYMVPKQIHFVRELPKTATGKIQRYLLREGP